MNISVDIDYDDVDTGAEHEADIKFVPGVRVTCSRCQNEAEAAGTGPGSVIVACNRLAASCPRREANSYFAQEM